MSEKPLKTPSAATRLFHNRYLRTALYLLVIVVTYFGMRAYQRRDLLPSGQTNAPPFTLATLSGQTASLQQWQGKRVVLFFFAPWCSSCKRNVEVLKHVAQQSDQHQLVVAAVALGYRSRAEVAEFQRRYQVHFPILMGDHAMERAYRIHSFPTTYVLDERGRVADSFLGYTPEFLFRWSLE